MPAAGLRTPAPLQCALAYGAHRAWAALLAWRERWPLLACLLLLHAHPGWLWHCPPRRLLDQWYGIRCAWALIALRSLDHLRGVLQAHELEGFDNGCKNALVHNLVGRLPICRVVGGKEEVQVIPLLADVARLNHRDNVAQALRKQHIGLHLPKPRVGAVDVERVDARLHGQPRARLVAAVVALELAGVELVDGLVALELLKEVVGGADMREPGRHGIVRLQGHVVGELLHGILGLANARRAAQNEDLPREAGP
mmetsp:Transcript_85514/g.198768  ORF Transcript_85514/g.198768 Transcript_85514/m.198768 type:complete len:254 (+) Transcript_85514:64-825(+)